MARMRANGVELEYEVLGRGEPLVLVMGVGAQLVMWPDAFCAELVARGFQVVRFDNRDVGLSTSFQDRGVPNPFVTLARRLANLPVEAPYTFVDMANDVAGLLDGLGMKSAHVVGISLGGMIAQTFAIHHPTRIRSLTSIMSTTGCRRHMLSHPRALLTLLRPRPREPHAFEDWLVDTFKVFANGGFPVDERFLREVAALSFARSRGDGYGALRQLAAMLASGSRREPLSQVKVPTTVIHGALDPLILPSAGRATARAIPNARFRLIDNMGHHLPREAWPIIIDEIVHVAGLARRGSSHVDAVA